MLAELSVVLGEFKAANTYKLSAKADWKTVQTALDDMNAQLVLAASEVPAPALMSGHRPIRPIPKAFATRCGIYTKSRCLYDRKILILRRNQMVAGEGLEPPTRGL
jgi:hypothetical protein